MPTVDELKAFLAAEFPQSTMEVLSAGGGKARGRQAVDERHLRPGGTVSGPAMMALADAVVYVALLADIGIVPLAVTTNLNMSFLRKPKADRAVIGEATMLKTGQSLAFAQVVITSEGEDEAVATALVTYAIPPPRP